MPIYQLPDFLWFPNPKLAHEGIIAVGGDLKPERLLLGYHMGIFPWFSDDEPIIWWSPDPRFVLFPDKIKVSKSMRPILRKKRFRVSYDCAFEQVIDACKVIKRKDQEGTWITGDMKEAYCKLHEMGYAHSVEVWEGETLVGGLYGVSLGQCFFGESMFTRVSNASKVGFITLVRALIERGFQLIDCQVYTEHLASLGAEDISRDSFLTLLEEYVDKPTYKGNWNVLFSQDSH